MLPQIKKYGIIPNEEYGQNFLVRQDILLYQIEYAKIQSDDVVLEIGPGIGNLTELLAQKAQKVIAIEKDTQFKNCLGDLQRQYKNLEIFWQDAVLFSYPFFSKVVANLPFKVSLPITFKILERPFSKAILLYQKTMAERICALPGEEKYSRVSVQMHRLCQPRFLQIIKKSDFYPPPEVDCALIELNKIDPLFSIPDNSFFKNALDYLFFYRESTLKEACATLGKKNSPSSLDSCLSRLVHLWKKKVSKITPVEFGVITEALYQYKIKVPGTSDGKKKQAQKIHKGNKKK
ncbi:MAG: ribosomal RNA small subunit methyltransferase A [Candidatus Brocadiae bacterium]|nr:ribosomal RNA small subunit methyltransferase A [Candidatus Brocadiia bacterium]